MDALEPMRMHGAPQFRKALILAMVSVLWLCLSSVMSASAAASPDSVITALDRGFLGLYNLDFTGAQKDFSAWEAEHPDDPVGPGQ